MNTGTETEEGSPPSFAEKAIGPVLERVGVKIESPSLRLSITIRGSSSTEHLHDTNSLSGGTIPVLFLLQGRNKNARSCVPSGWRGEVLAEA